MSGISYKGAGVDAAAADRWLEGLRAKLPAIGGFAALFPLADALKGLEDPALVSCVDGVGTKVLVARAANNFSTVGQDCVAMVLNDMVCCGARPLFFLDYLAVAKFDEAQADQLIEGLRLACDACGCALVGGETAELPGLLAPGEFDICGFAVGIVDRKRALPRADLRAGDLVIGLPSSGVHSNGLSLARRALPEYATDAELRRELLTPTRLYVRPVLEALAKHDIKAIAHITGGGLPGNLCRVLPPDVDAQLFSGNWPVPTIFHRIAEAGGIARPEMFETFNMGLGLCLVAPPDAAPALAESLAGEGARIVGQLEPGTGKVKVDELVFA
ncbi:MAG: phosphoribosylformylglycinamidine cyclo-ligase [Candidatus Sumerlaeia bacterium]|nr:phosphoribosylformylglycinamidine cyclo-ligase [Candidatus Sumerlaeia bacterium]